MEYKKLNQVGGPHRKEGMRTVQKRGKHEGSIYRRPDGRWAASVSLGKIDGSRHRPTVYARTRTEVQKKLSRLRLELHLGNSAEASKIRLTTYLDGWLDSSVTRETSNDLYSTIKRLHIDPYIGSLFLTKLTPQVIKQFFGTLKRRNVSPSVMQHTYDTLRWALTGAVVGGLLGKNPISCVQRPKFVPTEMSSLNEQQLRQFLEAAKEDRYFALYVLASYGLRQGELFGLTDHDIDWERGEIHVRQSLHLVRGKRALGMLKTGASKRTLKLAPSALNIIREHLGRLEAEGWTQQKRAYPLAGGQLAPLLFVNTQGKPLHRPAVREHSFKKILKRAGLPDIRFHDLRHTAASLMLHKGYGVLAVSKWLGHAKASTTLNLYGHLLVDDCAKMADELDRLLNP